MPSTAAVVVVVASVVVVVSEEVVVVAATVVLGPAPGAVVPGSEVDGAVAVVEVPSPSSAFPSRKMMTTTITTNRPARIQAVRFMVETYPDTLALKASMSPPEAATRRARRWMGMPTTVNGLPFTLLTKAPPRPWRA